jgi:multimeric flavodoxin WrbA
MKVLGIIGSNRKAGNTATMVSKILSTLEEMNIETEKLFLSDYNYSSCNGCEGCRKTYKCVLKDDMQDIYKKIMEADAIVIGSPTYFYNITAETKAFLDRLYCYEIFDSDDRSVWIPLNEVLGLKYAVTVSVCEQEKEEDMGFTPLALSKPLEALGYRVIENLKVLKVFEAGKVNEIPENIKKAENAGKKLGRYMLLRKNIAGSVKTDNKQ